ncbi:UNVERIFIED_CONTAM: hypothetical protein RMT77_010008 [Armadillidium vulgare]
MDEIHSQNSVEIDMSLETHLEGATVQDHSTSTNNDPLVSDLNINKTLIPDDDLKKYKDKIKRRRSSYGHHLSRRSICTKVPEHKEVESNSVAVQQVSAVDSDASKSEQNSLEKEAER